MSKIVIPSSAYEQGYAFEDLILSYYQKSGLYKVCEWSSYLHGLSDKWWQCDGIVENNRGRYLIEAKFFNDRPATVRDVNPSRRQTAAQDLDCTGILYISLNDFTSELRNWPHSDDLDIAFVNWADMRAGLLSDLSDYATVFLDEFQLTSDYAASIDSSASLRLEDITTTPLSSEFPEFVVVSDNLERWLRRMPCFPLQLTQTSSGHFWYDSSTEQVELVPDRASDLSLQEAWAIQDAISGYASRTYNAVRATAEALAKTDKGTIDDVQKELHSMGWETGKGGVRRAIDFLVQLDMARKWRDGRRNRYALRPLGKAYVVDKSGPDDDLFGNVLKAWLPYRAICEAIEGHSVPPTTNGIMSYFKMQYEPYEPYARSLFNPNKADGLTRLYKLFGS
jgi:hypothetical protein